MQTQKIYWPAVLLMLLFGFGVLLLWGLTVVLGITSLPTLFTENPETLTVLILAASTGFQGLVLLAAGSFAFFKVIGRDMADKDARIPFANWHIPALLAVSVVAILVGSLLKDKNVPSLFLLPILTLVATIAPLWLFMGIGTSKMDLGPRWRTWGIFGLGMTLGPVIMLSLEVLLGITIALGIAVYFAMRPELVDPMMQLATQLQSITDPEEVLDLLVPYILKPIPLIIVLGYTAILVPLIEEFFKPIGVWLFARQLKTPNAGFVMGILSGTAYALVENLGMTAQAGTDWTTIVSARAATGLLHITTTGLMGWAIVYMWNERGYLRFFGSYLTAITLHGLWNSAGVSLAFYAAAEALRKGKEYQWFAVLGVLVMGSLVIVLLTILINSNRLARTSGATSAVAPQENGQT
jgi:RsiW-degrading membrane proteinase PrsW (M82 family)